MTIKTDIENLKYPVGKFQRPEIVDRERISGWVKTIREFPFKVFDITHDLTDDKLSWAYRPEGWSIRQLVNHCADSHMHSFIRLKWTLTEDSPTIKAYHEGLWAKLPDSTTGSIKPALMMLDGLHERWVSLLEARDIADFNKYFIHPETGKETPLGVNTALYAWHCEHHLAHIQLALEFEGKYLQRI